MKLFPKKTSLWLTYIVDLLLYSMVVALFYVPDWLYGDNLLPFTYNNIQFDALWYHFAAFVLLSVGIYVRVNQLGILVEECGYRYWQLELVNVLPLVLSLPFWFLPDYRVFAWLLVAFVAMSMIVDLVFYIRNEYSQVFVFMLVILVFAATNVYVIQWRRMKMMTRQATMVVEQCSTSAHWTLPAHDWSVACYDGGRLERSEGRFRFLSHFDSGKLDRRGDYRTNNQNNVQFVFERDDKVYVVSRAAWPSILTNCANTVGIFFMYIALCILVYWANVVLRRRMLIRRSFFGRLRVSLLFFILGSLMVMLGFTMGFMWYRYTTNARDSLKYVMTLLVDYATPVFDSPESVQGVFKYVKEMSLMYDAEISIYDDSGYLVYTTDSISVVYNISFGENNPFARMQSAVEGRVVFDYAWNMTVQSYGVFTPKTQPQYYAVMWSESDMARMRNELTYFLVILLVLYFIFAILAVVFSYIVSRQLANPLRDIDRCLSDVSLDSPNPKIEVTNDDNDELSLLIRNYNQMIDKLEESATELALVERENSWRDMSRQIAHEIKNPLTPMRLILQQMMINDSTDAEALKAKIRGQVEILLTQVDSLYATACSLSDFARQPLMCPVPVNMVEKANHVAALFRHNDSNVAVDVEVKPQAGQATVLIDKDMALRMLTNLVRNAIQAIPDTRRGVVKITIDTADGHVVVSVSDNGIGMTPDVIKNIFNTNFTTKIKGMGLGLYVVKTVVTGSNGTIDVESVPDEGTTFTITLPQYVGK